MSCALHHPGTYTLADWDSLDHAPDGPRIELIGGRFEMTPPPAYTHQLLSDELRLLVRTALREARKDDLRVVSAIGVALAADTAVIPDLVVVRALPDGAVRAEAADVLLAVEIVSPGSRKVDRMVKPTAYAEAGVRWFWRVEPTPGEPPTVVCFELDGTDYAKQATVTGDESQVVRVADIDVTLDLARLYRGAFPAG
ncbi:MAG: Uma2 family endonuclease [Sciscionella sp.]